MKIELVVDKKYTSPKVVIYCNEVNSDISTLMNSINNNQININGYIDNTIYILNLDDIYSFYSEGGKVYAKTNDNVFLIKYRLYELEEMLLSKKFIRISNSEIINLRKLKNLDFSLLGTVKLNFINNSYTYTSRRFIKKIKDYFNI